MNIKRKSPPRHHRPAEQPMGKNPRAANKTDDDDDEDDDDDDDEDEDEDDDDDDEDEDEDEYDDR